MNMLTALIWGFAATLVLTTLQAASRDFGFSRMDLPFILGTMFTSHRDRAKAIGFVVHLLNGWIFALFYIAVIEISGIRHWWFGMLIGLIQGLFMITIVAQELPGIHPRMADEERGPDSTRQLEPPGSFCMNYGKRTPLVALISHMIYGAILGFFYHH